MSTRRTTRATSRATSSRGASPALSESDIPATPSSRKASRRSTANTPLPAVGTRTSTAYGSNTTAQPASMRGPEGKEEISNVLVGLLEPVREEDPTDLFAPPDFPKASRGGSQVSGSNRGGRGGRRGGSVVSQAPVADRSFAHESGIFGDAGLDSSSVDEENEPGFQNPTPKQPRPQKLSGTAFQNSQPIIAEIAQNTRVERVREETRTAPDLPFRTLARLVNFLSEMFSYLMSILDMLLGTAKNFKTLLIPVLFIIILVLFSRGSSEAGSPPIRWYGAYDIKHNIGQFIPTFISHPTGILEQANIQDLQARMTAAEYEIAHLKTRTDLDSRSISRLEELLPDFIVCKKDDKGNLQIPDQFWNALEAKIRADRSLFEDQSAETESISSSTTGLSKKEIVIIAQKQAERVFDNSNTKNWDKFLKANRAQIVTWSEEGLKVSKQDFLQLIQKNWDDLSSKIDFQREQFHTLQKEHVSQMKSYQELAKSLEYDYATITQVHSIARQVTSSFIASAQLEGLAEANLKHTVTEGLARINHFSKGTGAAIVPYLTSPNFVFPSMRRHALSRAFLWAVHHPVPIPNGPEHALSKWEEHGDCWCSPVKDAEGFGPSLAVIMGNYIIPDQVIVEHIPQSAALEPGAAPKDMELLAYIEDVALYYQIKDESDKFYRQYGDEFHGEQQHPVGYVRIGHWTYNAESAANVQSFPVQFDLKKFGVFTNNLIVRVKNNWGGDKVQYTCLYRVRVNGDIHHSAEPEA